MQIHVSCYTVFARLVNVLQSVRELNIIESLLEECFKNFKS